MTTLTTRQITREPGLISRELRAGNEVSLTFHDRPYARVVPHAQIEQERAQLADLRREVEYLRSQIGGSN